MPPGLTADIELCDTSEEGGFQAGLRLLDRPAAERPTAVFAASDLIALGVMSAAAELGHSIPTKISLVGVDDTHLVKMRSIWLTSVDLFPYEQGRLCGETIVTRVADPDRPATEQPIEPSLQICGSTGAPQPGAPVTPPGSAG